MSAELARPRPSPGPGGRRRTLPLILGLTAAAAAFLGVVALGSLGNHGGSAATVKVLVAARDIQARETIAADMVATANLAQGSVPPGAVLDISSVKGETVLAPILRGQPITTNLLTSSPDTASAQTSYLPIPPGFVARAIPSGEQQGVAGYIAPGDYINVIATVNTNLFGDARARQITKLVFTNVHVIRVGPATPGKTGQSQGVSSSLTVVMTACDAEMMDWLLGNAKLTYVLLSYHNYSSPTTQPDPSCPDPNTKVAVGPTQVNDRYGFTGV